MSLKVRREKTALEAKVKEHCAINQVFRSDLLEWIEVQKSVYVERLILENDDVTRGMIQMLDGIKKSFGIGE